MMRVCSDCGELIKTGPRCAACTSRRNIARGSSHQRGYTHRWRRISERARLEQPWCSEPGCTAPAVDTDHVVPLRAGGTSTRRNAAPLCRLHHARKTRQDATRYPHAR